MEESYAAGFGTCEEGTALGAERSLALLDKGNQELRAITARLMALAP
jgi:hypothetical protein